jgi:hypothetical protein
MPRELYRVPPLFHDRLVINMYYNFIPLTNRVNPDMNPCIIGKNHFFYDNP